MFCDWLIIATNLIAYFYQEQKVWLDPEDLACGYVCGFYCWIFYFAFRDMFGMGKGGNLYMTDIAWHMPCFAAFVRLCWRFLNEELQEVIVAS